MKNYWAGGTEGGNQSDFIKNNYWDGIYFGHNTKYIKGKKTADSNLLGLVPRSSASPFVSLLRE